ncbi:MAG TPA: sulfate adenylyltransferase subunit CysN [Marmoricola sp.]|nr:sulfate adenylyltransferase subunit CysN [Marmoricola sp.]
MSTTFRAEDDIASFLEAHLDKSMLRFITCGSVDDGKSTLIGRLLYESQFIFDDQLRALEADSRRVGTQGGDLDFALLVDGLAAEREQGITIDVAYRYFTTDARKFVVADTPGHEQYTRNMVTGASTADLAVILVDARQGLLTQTRRHTYLVSMLGIRNVVLAVNKLDLVAYDADIFGAIAADHQALCDTLGIPNVTAIPMSALKGDNVVARSTNMPWYAGPSLLEHLERVDVDSSRSNEGFRMPVQWVNRPNADFRGFSGVIAAGYLFPGDQVTALPSGLTAEVREIHTFDGARSDAAAGESVTVVLDREIDVSRGDMLVSSSSPAIVSDQLVANLVWMTPEELVPGRRYLVKIGTATVGATLGPLRHRVDVNTLERSPAKSLEMNQIGECAIQLDRPIAFDAYGTSRGTGSLIVIDRHSNATVGAGMVVHELRRGQNVHHQDYPVQRKDRWTSIAQTPKVIWFTGISGSGKSTIAGRVERRLHDEGVHTYLIDGDNLRHGLTRDLGFTPADRVENVRRAAEVAALFADAGITVLVSLISPYRDDRETAREIAGDVDFLEVFVDTPLDVAASRDPKGLYAKAQRGELPNMTGIAAPYEAPVNPEVHLRTIEQTVEESVEAVIATVRGRS